MKKIKVQWMTNQKKEEFICLPDTAKVQDLLQTLEMNGEDYLIVVNGSNRLLDYPLSDGDQITILYAMAGG